VLDGGYLGLVALPAVAIVAMVVAVHGRTFVGRALVLAAAAMLLAPAVMAAEPDASFTVSVLGAGAALALGALPIALWGAESGAAWLVAALAATAFAELRTLAAAAAPPDRAAAALAIAAALAGLAIVVVLTYRRAEEVHEAIVPSGGAVPVPAASPERASAAPGPNGSGD
jgi:hypothetical protein